MTVSRPRVPLFSTYKARENQVSHATAVAFERCARFRKILLEEIASRAPHGAVRSRAEALSRLYRTATVAAQCCFGGSWGKDEDQPEEKKSVPDVVIEFPGLGAARRKSEGKPACFLVEAKVEAKWERSQAERHTIFASRDYDVVLGIALTLDPKPDLPPDWIGLPWSKVYEAACRANSVFGWELRRVLEITEAKLMGKADLETAMTVFSGIEFGEDVPHSPVRARNIARLLAKELKARKDLLQHGIQVVEPKSISSGGSSEVWVEAAPLGCFEQLGIKGKLPHLNFTVASGHFGVGLTFPNQTFKRTLRNGIAKLAERGELQAEVARLLKAFTALSALGGSCRPKWYVAQNFYPAQRARPREDGRLEVDLRTMKGAGGLRRTASPRVKANPEWLAALTAVITEAPTGVHLQSGLGVDFKYSAQNREFLSSPEAVCQAVADVWIALIPFAELMAVPRRMKRRRSRR